MVEGSTLIPSSTQAIEVHSIPHSDLSLSYSPAQHVVCLNPQQQLQALEIDRHLQG